MAIAFESVSTLAYGSSNAAVITKPTGLAAGDLMIAHLVLNTAGGTDAYTIPGDWTLIDTKRRGGEATQQVCYKIADSDDAAASSFTFSINATTTRAGAIYRFSGHNPNNPIDTSSGAAPVDTATVTCGEVTPTYADSMLVALMNGDDTLTAYSAYAVATDNPTWTERHDFGSAGQVSAGATALRTAATSTGNFTATADSGNANTDHAIHLIVIKPITNVTVSPDTMTSTGTVNAPTVSGGAIVSPATITATSEVKTPAHNGQADWSAVDKSDTASWSNQSKS